MAPDKPFTTSRDVGGGQPSPRIDLERTFGALPAAFRATTRIGRVVLFRVLVLIGSLRMFSVWHGLMWVWLQFRSRMTIPAASPALVSSQAARHELTLWCGSGAHTLWTPRWSVAVRCRGLAPPPEDRDLVARPLLPLKSPFWNRWPRRSLRYPPQTP